MANSERKRPTHVAREIFGIEGWSVIRENGAPILFVAMDFHQDARRRGLDSKEIRGASLRCWNRLLPIACRLIARSLACRQASQRRICGRHPRATRCSAWMPDNLARIRHA